MKGRYHNMKIIIINDEGKREVIRCRKIEPATMAINPETLKHEPRLVIDEGERVINLFDVTTIID